MLEGVIVPLITPFRKDGELFKEAFDPLLDFLIKRGVSGFFLCGTYGTGPLLTLDERKNVVELVMERVKADLKVIVHVGTSNIDMAFELAKHAQEVGAYAVASTPPFYQKYDEDEILSFFKGLVSKVNIPVYAYNNPARSGNEITPKLLKRLIEAGVVGMKDSEFDIIKFYQFAIEAKGTEFDLVIGTERLLLPAYMIGSRACISGLSNCFPEVVVELYRKLKEGSYEEAKEAQLKAIMVGDAVELAPAVQSTFEVLRMRGVDVGYPKPPLRMLTDEEKMKVKDALRKLEMI